MQKQNEKGEQYTEDKITLRAFLRSKGWESTYLKKLAKSLAAEDCQEEFRRGKKEE